MAPVERTLQGVEVVFLDAGNTLVRADPPIEVRYAETAAQHGMQVPAAEIRDRFRSQWRAYTARRAELLFTTDQDATKAFWRLFVKDVFSPWVAPGAAFDAFFDQLYEEFASRRAWKVFDDVRPALDGLHALGLRLGVISNWDIRLPQMLSALDLTRHFQHVLVSAAEGLEKPAAELFVRACQRMAVAPERALHVGDSLEEDVRGAIGAGLRAALIDRGRPLPFYVDTPARGAGDYLVLRSLTDLVERLGGSV